MYSGEIREGMAYEARPGVTADRYSRPEDMLWRYLPFDRFAEIIAQRKLFFVRLSTYVREGIDDHEGASPVYLPNIMEMVAAQRGQLQHYKANEATYGVLKLQTVLVNCWHKREHEEDWMWRSYGRGRDAVAIVTRLDYLIDSMPEFVTVGHVEYSDFSTERTFHASIFTRAFMKRLVHEADREVRAVLQDDDLIKNGWGRDVPGKGLWVPIHLERLIEAVVVRDPQRLAPTRKILAEAGLTHVPVLLSVMLKSPKR